MKTPKMLQKEGCQTSGCVEGSYSQLNEINLQGGGDQKASSSPNARLSACSGPRRAVLSWQGVRDEPGTRQGPFP